MLQSTMMNTPLSINHFLDRAKRLFPNSQITSRLPNKNYVTHSFSQFHDRSLQLAAALIKLGVGKGDRVATLCWNHHVHLECYFGIPAAGAVMHTLNLRLSPSEIAWIAQDASDRVLIVDDILLPLYEQIANEYRFDKVIVFAFSGQSQTYPEGALDYEKIIGEIAPLANPVEHLEDDPISMCYTSGTTGRPKGVVYSHRSTVLHTLVASLTDNWGLSSSDAVLPVTPMFHANSWGMPYGAVMLGSNLIFPGPHLNPVDLLDLMQSHPPTLALGVPTIWMSIIQAFDAEPTRWKMPAMRSLVGGAAVPEALIRAFAKRGVQIVQGWGMTETSPLATVAYIKPEFLASSEDEKFKLNATAGVPAPLVEFRLIGEDADGRPIKEPQPWDGKSVGEIQVRGPFITADYYPRKDDARSRDAGKFTDDGWLRTGDVALITEHGYVRITDRTKDLIKSGGEWISSVDMENAIMAHPDVAESAVIAIPDPKWSERPLACIAMKNGKNLSPEIEEALNQLLSNNGFAKWQLPHRYQAIDQVPRTSTGKFWKAKLREMFPS